MDYPKRSLFGLTWVGWINLLVLQWFCIRLGYGGATWQVVRWVVPMSGWWSKYQFITRR